MVCGRALGRTGQGDGCAPPAYGVVDETSFCPKAGRAIPPGTVHHRKLDLAPGLIGQALGWKSPPGVVLADEAYGGSFAWGARLCVRARGLFDGVRVPWTTTGWQEAPLRAAQAGARGLSRTARTPLRSPEPQALHAIAQSLPALAWKKVT